MSTNQVPESSYAIGSGFIESVNILYPHQIYLKGKSTLIIFDKHANLKYRYGKRAFWCKGYYVSAVCANKKAVQEYIRNQENEDIMMDQISFKAYEDPFKNIQWNDDDSPDIPADSKIK